MPHAPKQTHKERRVKDGSSDGWVGRGGVTDGQNDKNNTLLLSHSHKENELHLLCAQSVSSPTPSLSLLPTFERLVWLHEEVDCLLRVRMSRRRGGRA